MAPSTLRTTRVIFANPDGVGMKWTQLAQDRVSGGLLSTLLKGKEFLHQLSDYQLLRGYSAP